METATKEGKYIYCIIKIKEPRNFGPLGIGGRADELHAICYDGIAAVVSNSPIITYSVSRENMISHEKAIEEVMKEYTVLPVRFATIAKDEEKVKQILRKEGGKFRDLLDKFNGKKELGLKAIFKETLIYQDILKRYENIKELKEKIAALPVDKTYFHRMEIGRIVEDALEKEKEICKESILNTLHPLAEDVKINASYGERMIINAAFLVDEEKEAEFDQKVQQLHGAYSDMVKFKYIGVIPPFNFVNLSIETGQY